MENNKSSKEQNEKKTMSEKRKGGIGAGILALCALIVTVVLGGKKG